jgi:hypothetical protein
MPHFSLCEELVVTSARRSHPLGELVRTQFGL